MYLVLTRSIKEALKNIFRNIRFSVPVLSILVLSLYVISIFYINASVVGKALEAIQEKVNISVYFKSDVPEEDMMLYKSQIEEENSGIIKSIDYVSREKALEDFRMNNLGEPTIIKSLDEIGENPLLASLVIKTYDPSQYPQVVSYLQQSTFGENISRINYEKNKEIITKLSDNIKMVKRMGVTVGILFLIVSVLIIFNTISLTIYTRKEEIEVMRLVGASNAFIRLPFIFESIIYGIIASLISMIILFASVKFGTPGISRFVSSKDFVSFFLDNILIIFLMQAGIGIILGILGSLIAVRKHLKI